MAGDWALQNPKEVFDAQTHIWNRAFAAVGSEALRCALELGIIDAIYSHGGPMTLDELVAATSVQPSKARFLHRIMTLLIHMGFFELHKEPGGDGDEEGAYGLNKVSALLAENHPQSMKAFVAMLDFKTLDPMSAWFRNNHHTTFEMAQGMNAWSWDRMAINPELNNCFNAGMENDSELIATILLGHYRSVFEGLSSLVDVGGGTGAMARAISSAFPDMECAVMDLPHVVAGKQGTENLKFVAGDMFQKIPPANAVMLKCILHDWNDQESLKILKNCRAAIPRKEEGGKLIIIDMVVTDTKGDYKLRETQLWFDVGMMVHMLGKERNEREWAKLFTDAGFSSYKINPVLGIRSVIEVYP